MLGAGDKWVTRLGDRIHLHSRESGDALFIQREGFVILNALLQFMPRHNLASNVFYWKKDKLCTTTAMISPPLSLNSMRSTWHEYLSLHYLYKQTAHSADQWIWRLHFVVDHRGPHVATFPAMKMDSVTKLSCSLVSSPKHDLMGCRLYFYHGWHPHCIHSEL